jgi:hypothetical protein
MDKKEIRNNKTTLNRTNKQKMKNDNNRKELSFLYIFLCSNEIHIYRKKSRQIENFFF